MKDFRQYMNLNSFTAGEQQEMPTPFSYQRDLTKKSKKFKSMQSEMLSSSQINALDLTNESVQSARMAYKVNTLEKMRF